METNMNVEIHEELNETGRQLLSAAYEFWKVHQKLAGPRAVVWLETDDGYFVVFTRGEYRDTLLRNITPLSDETPLDGPFVIEAAT